MEEVIQNLNQDDVLDLIRDFPLQPLGRRVIITVNTEEEDGLNLNNETFAQSQYAVAVGNGVMDFKPGQKVLLDINKLMKRTVNPETGEDVFHLEMEGVDVLGKRFGIITDSNVLCNDNR